MKQTILIVAVMILSLWHQGASAFWGSDATESASGLNVAAGFDVNTVTTVAGAVLTPPERKGQSQHTVMTMSAPQGTVTIVLGPWWYWEKNALVITKNQEISVTGSLAQGKDGALYLFAQKVENRSAGETVILRSESGKPLWSRGGGNRNGNRPLDGRGAGMKGGQW